MPGGGGDTENTHTRRDGRLTVITKRLSVCMAHDSLSLSLSLSGPFPLSPSVCVWISQCLELKSSGYLKCEVFMLGSVIRSGRSPPAERREALQMSPERGSEPPGCRSGGTSRCRLRPPCSAALSHPVWSPCGHTATTAPPIGRLSSPPGSRAFLLAVWSLPVQRRLDPFNKRSWTQPAGVAVLSAATTDIKGEEEITSRPLHVPTFKKHDK